MRVLIDTNLLITYLSGREDRFAVETETIMRLCADGQIEGVVAFHSLSTIWYITRKIPQEMRRGYIKKICLLLTVSGADQNDILRAIDNQDFHDFEDALQDCCAQKADCDYIVTANIKDFAEHSQVKAVGPDDFVAIVSAREEKNS